MGYTESEMRQILNTHNRIRQEARVKLFTINQLFAATLYKFYWRVDFNCPSGALGYVASSDGTSDDVAGNSIFFSPQLFLNKKLNVFNYIFILEHEILHILSGHISRRGYRDPTLWNMACDHVINTLLRDIYKQESNNKKKCYPVSWDATKDSPAMDGWESVFIDETIKENLTAEEVYAKLSQQKTRFKFKSLNGNNSSNGEGDDNTDAKFSKDDQNNWVEIEDTVTGKKYIVNARQGSEEDKENERTVQSEAREHIKQRGLSSSHLNTYLKTVLEVKVPWDEILKNAIKKHTRYLPARRSWARPNKFYQPIGRTMPSVINRYVNDAVGTCIIGVDTSGSIGTKDLEKFSSIIVQALDKFKEVIFITHDVEVHQKETFSGDNKHEFIKFIKSIGFKGRGGTSHHHVFKEIEDMYEDQFNNISLALFLTDGYSDVETEWKKFEWSSKDKIPTYFVITEDGTLIRNIKETVSTTSQSNPRQVKIKD